MIVELILSAVCSGPACVEKTVEKEVTRHKVVSVIKERDVQPVRKAVLRVRHRDWRILRGR